MISYPGNDTLYILNHVLDNHKHSDSYLINFLLLMRTFVKNFKHVTTYKILNIQCVQFRGIKAFKWDIKYSYSYDHLNVWIILLSLPWISCLHLQHRVDLFFKANEVWYWHLLCLRVTLLTLTTSQKRQNQHLFQGRPFTFSLPAVEKDESRDIQLFAICTFTTRCH